MVDIEHHALRAFKQDALVRADLLIQRFPDRLRIGEDFRRDLEEFLLQRLTVWLWQADAGTKWPVVGKQALDLEV